MALKSPRTRRTKSEIEQEFAGLVESVALEKTTSSTRLEMAASIQEAEVRAAVSELTVEVISKKLSELSIEISRTLSNLSENMTGEVNLLKSLKEAVTLERKDLQKLHAIDIAATSIDQLISDYSEKKKDLEAEISQIRDNWKKEKEQQHFEETEQAEILTKNRIRENEDYEYKKSIERKKLQDKFEEEWRLKEKQNRDTQESLEKCWKEREESMKSKEEEFLSLQKEVSQFSTRLATECAKAVNEASKEIETKYTQEITNLKRDLVVEKQISELKIQQLQELLASGQTQMAALQAQLDEAKRQVQDIAVKAIEGASGAKTLSHVNQIAIEQAKNRPQN